MPESLPTCATCNHWLTSNTFKPGWGTCRIVGVYADDEDLETTRAKAHSMVNLQIVRLLGSLQTAPDFGCVQHEKDEPGA
jgi:hypothetical protein